MIQANCRDRFTAEDFDFVVKTLCRSLRDSVGLQELLTDSDVRDAVLDHEMLLDAIISQPRHLSISPQFYFYILIRRVLKQTGISDRRISDYLASLLENFSRTTRLKSPVDEKGFPVQYLSDMLLALQNATPVQTFLIRAHVGNYSLFITGIFRESVEHRSRHGAPDFTYYEEMGRANYNAVANHAVARSCELSSVFKALSERFHEVRLALNCLSEKLLNIDDESNIPLLG